MYPHPAVRSKPVKRNRLLLGLSIIGAVLLFASTMQLLFTASANRGADDGAHILAHRVYGGGRTPLVAIHGSPGSRADFSTLGPALQDHFTVFAFDMPGFGESARVPGHWGYAAAADALD
mgnify:CR=1 FL=1